MLTNSCLGAAIQNETERCAHLRKTINMLPPKHRDCLEFLMFHLARVASRERENLVSFDMLLSSRGSGLGSAN